MSNSHCLTSEICRALSEDCDRSLLFALSPDEISHINEVTEEVKTHLQSIAHLGIAEIRKQGSLAKGTAVVGFEDVDLVVMFNRKFKKNGRARKHLRIMVTAALQSRKRGLKGMTVKPDGADDIIVCIYKEVSIDLVLVGKNDEHNDERANGFKQGLRDVEAFQKSIGTNGWVLDVIRAAKHWCKRHVLLQVLKSVLVEHIVLNLWKAHPRQATETLAQVKQRLFLAFLDYLKNRCYEQGGVDPLIGECRSSLEAFSAHLAITPAAGGVQCQLCGV